MSSRTAWITGGSKGLGRALALHLCREGWTVAISARGQEDMDAVVNTARDLPGRMAAVACDVTDEQQVREALERVTADYGLPELVVLNAGTHQPIEAKDFKAADVRKLVEINLMGVVHGLEAAMPRMIERGGGRIAVVASVAGYRGLPSASGYGATKSALNTMVESLKPDLDRYGVSIHIVNPGFVATPLTAKNEFPMPFLMQPEDAARALYKGLEKGSFEITFPKRLTYMLKIGRCLPHRLWFAITRRML